jgi:hypothetical protein
MKSIILKNQQSKLYCQSLIQESPDDGSITVEIKKTKKDSTSKQRRLQWMWYTEIANSGLGSDDNKNDVHTRAKWQFCRPILLRDCEIFPIILNKFEETIQYAENKSELYRIFSRDYISTERLSKSQRAEYLTDFQRYWASKGVCLSDPELQGLELESFKE